MYAYHSETFENAGFRFRADYYHDASGGLPWIECETHGVVREGTKSYYTGHTGKRPHEVRIDAGERNRTVYFYDVRESTAIAKRDKWGLSDDTRAALAARLKREPTAREVTAEAVRLDCDRLHAWLHNRWHWCGVVVTLLGEDDDGDEVDTDESESLWGIESDAGAYFDQVKAELAERIAKRVGPEYVRTYTVRARHAAGMEGEF